MDTLEKSLTIINHGVNARTVERQPTFRPTSLPREKIRDIGLAFSASSWTFEIKLQLINLPSITAMVSFKHSAIRTANNCNLKFPFFCLHRVEILSWRVGANFFFTPLCFSGDVTPPPRVWSKKQRYVIVMGFKNKSGTCTCVQKSRFDCHNFICNLKPLQETSKTNVQIRLGAFWTNPCSSVV